MARKPRTACTWPAGCRALVDKPGRCTKHQRLADRQRGSARERGYDSQWERIRKRYLEQHPYCEDGCGQFATDVDHEPPRRELIAQGVHDPDDERYLRALCHRHHSRKTSSQNPSGRS